MPRKFTEWSYVSVTLAAFVFFPEIRRLVDWRGNFDPLNVFSVLPPLMLLPIAVFLYKRRSAILGRSYVNVSVLWFSAFTYALLIGVVYKSILPGIYGFGLFVLPVLVGAWLVALDEPVTKTFDRLSRLLFVFGAFAGVYGIIQFALAPPWDTAWMENVGATSFGQPERFGIRVFSVMNSPGTYAEFTAASLILNFPNMRLGRPWSMLATLIMIASLLLSLVRSAWLAVLIGAVVFAVLSPRRLKAMVSLAAVCSLFAVLAAGFFAFVPSDEVRQTLGDRVDSLTGISDDGSAIDREQTSTDALNSAVANPLGHGLGLTGQPAALASSEMLAASDLPEGPIDNGFLSRFVEMGYPGLAAYLAALLLAMFLTYQALRRNLSRGTLQEATVSSACLAAQIAMFLVSISGDVFSGVGSVVFFIAVGIGAKQDSSVKLDATSHADVSGSVRPRLRAV